MSIGFAMLAWVLDSLLDSLIFQDGTVIGQIINPANREIGIRLLFGSIFIVFGIYIQKTENSLKVAVIKAEDEKNKTQEIIEAIGDGIIIQDTDYKIVYQNQIQNEIYGNRAGEYCYKAYEGKDNICEDCPIELSFKDGKIHKTQRIIATDKGILYYELTGSLLRDSTGKIIGGVKVVRDITGLKRVEERLRESEGKYRALFEATPVGIGIADLEGKILDCNANMLEITGFTLEELKSMDGSATYVDPDERKMLLKTLHETGRVRDYEVRLKRKDGTIYYSLLNADLLELKGNKVILTTSRDITESKRAEREKDRFLRAFASSIDGITIADEKDRFIYVNKAYAGIYGYHQDDLIGNTWHKITPTEIIAQTEKGLANTMHNMDVGTFYGEVPGLRKDGIVIPTEVRGKGIWDENGKYQGHICIVRDITERKRSEEELKAAHKRFEDVLNSVDSLVYAIDMRTYEVLFINKFGRDNWGDIEGKICWQSLQKGQSGPCEFCTNKRLIGPDGKPSETVVWDIQNTSNNHWYECRDKAIYWPDGRVVRIEFATDITERKQAEEKMKKYARELEEANQLKDLFTDIIRHDLLNPVTVIKGLSEILSEDESLPKNKKNVEMILKNVGKLEEMIQSASTLAKVEAVDKLDFEERDLCKILRKVISDFTPMFRNKGMSVEFLGEAKCIAEVNPHIEDIFSNLLSNAVKYSHGNTPVTVGIKADGEDYIISVKDRGNKIPDEYKEIIFERFKRIEKRGVKGTGLGLSIVKRIVDIHKGRVWVEDNPEGGNVFLVRIPAKRFE
jgi:PAS domain S-box-containing protein